MDVLRKARDWYQSIYRCLLNLGDYILGQNENSNETNVSEHRSHPSNSHIGSTEIVRGSAGSNINDNSSDIKRNFVPLNQNTSNKFIQVEQSLNAKETPSAKNTFSIEIKGEYLNTEGSKQIQWADNKHGRFEAVRPEDKGTKDYDSITQFHNSSRNSFHISDQGNFLANQPDNSSNNTLVFNYQQENFLPNPSANFSNNTSVYNHQESFVSNQTLDHVKANNNDFLQKAQQTYFNGENISFRASEKSVEEQALDPNGTAPNGTEEAICENLIENSCTDQNIVDSLDSTGKEFLENAGTSSQSQITEVASDFTELSEVARKHSEKTCENVVEDNINHNSTLENFDNTENLGEESFKSEFNEAQKETEIVELQQHFEDFDPDNVDVRKDSPEYMAYIKERALSFKTRIDNYSGTNYSLEYFVIDENLMRLLEALDKVKCRTDEELLEEKIKVMRYINDLHQDLDRNATDE